jgi:hypothetical protein
MLTPLKRKRQQASYTVAQKMKILEEVDLKQLSKTQYFLMRGSVKADELLISLQKELEHSACAERRQTRLVDFFKRKGDSV